MRAILIGAVVGLGSTVALAGPSDHASRPTGGAGATERREARKYARSANAPSALTGGPVRVRVVVHRDVPKGRGQTEKLPFWIWRTH